MLLGLRDRRVGVVDFGGLAVPEGRGAPEGNSGPEGFPVGEFFEEGVALLEVVPGDVGLFAVVGGGLEELSGAMRRAD